jgi:uncharacterized phage-associated protein
MSVCAVESVLDIALWFQDRSRIENEHMQAQKLQRLLFVAQGRYAAEYHGRKLMPAVFVAHELGPLEPNIMRFFEFGPPQIPTVDPPGEVGEFLERLWLKIGHHSANRLGELARAHPAYRKAISIGQGEEIPFAAIVKGAKATAKKPPKQVKTADGRTVSQWMPPKKFGDKVS